MKNKKKMSLQITNETTDFNTGEIKTVSDYKEFYVDNEPEYIKLYIDHICIFNGLSHSISPILLKFCSYMTFQKEEDDSQLIFVTAFTKEKVAKALNLTINRINQALTEIIDAGIFKKIYDKKTGKVKRGVYIVNPYIIAKGKWKDIKRFRATFDYMEKTIKTDISTQKDVTDFLNDIEEQEEIKAKPKDKKTA